MAKKKETALSLEALGKQYKNIIVDPKTLTRRPDQLLRTGSPKIDLMLRGGFRPGTISELYGPEAGGKTTIALHVSKTVVDGGGKVLYIDLEHTLDGGVEFEEGKLRGWPEVIGVDITDTKHFLIARPTTGEEVYEFLEYAIQTGEFNLIVLDSMGGMVPRVDMEGDVGESAFGRLAKLNSEALKRVMAKFDTNSAGKTHLMIINQARDSVGTGYSGMRSTGGRALRHFVRTKLRCQRVGKNADEGTNTIRVRVDKSMTGPPWEEVEIYIHPDHGIDIMAELIQFAVDEGLVERNGAWYTLFDHGTGEEKLKVQGRNAIREAVETDLDLIHYLNTEMWTRGVAGIVHQVDPEEIKEKA